MSSASQIIKFGVPAAERDADLIDCFVQSDTYSKLASGQKTVILGNRGTGKSALFRKFTSDEVAKGNLVIALAPEDYSYEVLSQSLLKEQEGAWAKQGAYTAAWKYILIIRIMKEIAASGKRFKQGHEARIYNYLRDNHKDTDTSPIGMLISYLKRMEGLKIGKYEASAKARELKRLYSLEELVPFLGDIEEATKNRHIFVLVDELDKGWDASEDAIQFVAGLFQASMYINAQFFNVRAIISLRKELYDNIPSLYDDAQKIRDVIEVVEWNEPKLLELIARRIAKLYPETATWDFKDRWNKIFQETLEYRQTNSFNYIVDRTLYRPREMIQFCNDIAENAITPLISGDTPFGYSVIAESEYRYSSSRLQDICSEYRFQFPGMQSVLDNFRGMTYNFSREDLENHLLRIICSELPVHPTARQWCEQLETEQMIDALWSIGFLRAQAAGGIRARRRSGSTYLGSYQITTLNLKSIQRFQVHPMFRSYLGMKESKS